MDSIDIKISLMAQGPAKLVKPESVEMDKDDNGITNPNLHTRINQTDDTKYMLTVSGVNSYRTTSYNMHDEESTECEIP